MMRDECEFTCTYGQSGGALSTFGEPMASPFDRREVDALDAILCGVSDKPFIANTARRAVAELRLQQMT